MDRQQLDLFADLAKLLPPGEIYEQATEDLLVRIEEDRRIERKRPRYGPKELADYFSMWANTQPDGGLIVVGLGNDGDLLGFEGESQDVVNRVETAGPRFCPDARHETKRVPILNSKGNPDFLILIRVYYHQSKVVKTVSGDAFTRFGDEKHRLSAEQIRELEIDKGQIDFELDPAPFAYPRDFDLELVNEYALAWMAARELEQRPVTEVLMCSHLGVMEKDEFVPNISCGLLFARDPTLHFPGCKVRFLRFDGEFEKTGAEWNAVKDVTLDGLPLPRLIQRSATVVADQLRAFSRLNPHDGQFYTAPEYPQEAWYEALVNACVHRSYSQKNMNIFVKMFDDRLEVESPGGFPPLVTPENIYDTHQPRNPRLMEALRYLRFVKCAHEGTRRIRDSMLEMELPKPSFEQDRGDGSKVRVTLKNSIKQRRVWIDADVTSVVSRAIVGDLSEHEKRAINFVAENGKINVSQLQKLTGLSWGTAKKKLVRLVSLGVLEHNIRDLHTSSGRDTKAHFILRSSDSN